MPSEESMEWLGGEIKRLVEGSRDFCRAMVLKHEATDIGSWKVSVMAAGLFDPSYLPSLLVCVPSGWAIFVSLLEGRK